MQEQADDKLEDGTNSCVAAELSACQKRTEEVETHPASAVPSELNAL